MTAALGRPKQVGEYILLERGSLKKACAIGRCNDTPLQTVIRKVKHNGDEDLYL